MNKPLLITLEYPPQHGGIATYLAGEVAHFEGTVEVIQARNLFWDKWPQWLPILWAVKPQHNSSVWVSHVLPIGYIALVWKLAYNINYRVYLHGLDLVRPLNFLWKKFWVKMILSYADEIVVNSKATRDLLKKYSIDPSKAVVSYPIIQQVDPNVYTSKAKELRKKYGIGDRPILLSIGRLVKRKGIDVVIRALRKVWKEMPELVYVVVGEGEERDTLELTARGGHVIFTGSISDEEKYSWLASCNCFILTPLDDPKDFEGYGIVYKEAQMFGKPVIGSSTGGVPEAIDGKGTIVDPEDINQTAQAILKHVRS